MTPRFGFAKGALFAAATSICLLTAPQLAAAQPGPGDGPPDDGYNQGGSYYDPCARAQTDRSVVGGLLGAAAGATIGNSVTHGGAKVGGAIIGGVAGAAVGAGIGHASAACDSGQPVPYAGDQYAGGQYQDQGGQYQGGQYQGGQYQGGQYQGGQYQGPPQGGSDYGPPPPPPPPPGAYVPNDNDRYAGPGDQSDYRAPPRGRCQTVEERVFYPDGTTESSSVQACRDRSGHWHVTD